MMDDPARSAEEYEEQAKLREDELMALEAILPAAELGRPSRLSSTSTLVWLRVPAVLPGPTTVLVRTHLYSCSPQEVDATLPEKGQRMEVTTLPGIGHLPTLRLLLRLPRGYPYHSAPTIVDIDGDLFGTDGITLSGLSDSAHRAKAAASSRAAASRAVLVRWLKEVLLQQWQAFRGEILYTWYEHLKEGLWQELLSSSHSAAAAGCPITANAATLTFDEHVVEEEETRPFESPLAASLRSHDILSKRRMFEGERFGCGVCLEEKRGGRCWKVSDCGHVFCQDCLTGYLTSMISEGYIRQASACPDPECVKARVAAENKAEADQMKGAASSAGQVGAISRTELLQFVGPQLVNRLEELREKAIASADPTAGYCPRPGCELLVRADPGDIGTSYESMRICKCGFTYCLYCSKAWHGKAPCNLLSSTALIERYQKAGEGSIVRREMEIKYGKANLERMVRNHEEETQNRQYIESNTQKCPCCAVRIEKSMGCNHMTCRSCHTHLCYRCGTRLNPSEPYKHFNTPNTPCFQKLFDVVTGAGGADGRAFLDAGEEDPWGEHYQNVWAV